MYKLLANGYIFKTDNFSVIPPDNGNADYLAYLDWVALGNTPLPQDPPIVQTYYVNKLIIRRRMRAIGLETAGDSLLAANSQAARDWADAVEIANDDATVLSIITAAGADPAVILRQGTDI